MRVFHGAYRIVFLVALFACIGLYLAAPAVGISRGAVVWPAVAVLAAIVLVADYLPPRLAGRAANKARDLAKQRHFEEAIAAYDEWIRRYGRDRGLRCGLAMCLGSKCWALTQLGRFDDSIKVCDEILDGFGDDDEPSMRARVAQALQRKAYCQGELGRVDELVATLDEVFARFSESIEPNIRNQVAAALEGKEVALGRAGRFEDAIKVTDEVFRRYADATQPGLRARAAAALDHKGGWLAELGRTTKAIATWDDLDARYRESSDPELRLVVAHALLGKAVSLTATGQRSSSTDICRQIISRYRSDGQPEMDRFLANAHVNIAMDLASNGGPEEEAEASFRQAIDLDPCGHNLGAYAWFLEIVRRDADGAESYYRKAIEAEADPQPESDAQTLGFYASFLDTVRHDLDGAESYHLQAIELAPEGVERAGHLNSYADFLEFARHDCDKAEEFCKKAIEADPADGRYLESYARFLQTRRKDLDAAESFYRRSIDADPMHQTHFAGYANFLAAFRHDATAAETQYRAAEQHCRESIDAGDSPRMWSVLLAQVVLAQGRTADGLKLLSQSDEPRLRPDLQLVLRLLRFAHESNPSLRVSGLAAVKELLNSGVRARGADLDGNCIQARLAGHPEPDLLEKLAGVISNGDDIKELDAFAAWRAARAESAGQPLLR